MDGATLSHIQTCGRMYAQTEDVRHVTAAAILAACAEPSERATIRFYWEEGVRNYADHMGHYYALMEHYDETVKHLTTI